MNAKQTFWRALSPEEKKALADRLETSVAYLSQVFNAHRKPGNLLAKRLVAESQGALGLADLLPELFGPVQGLGDRRGKRQSAGTAEGVGAVTPGSGSNAATATDAEDAA